jgi:hypothetical protein
MNRRPEEAVGAQTLAALLLPGLGTGQFFSGMWSRAEHCARLAGMSTTAKTSTQGEAFPLCDHVPFT